MKDERGVALVTVILIVALLGILVGEFAFSMRLEATIARSFKERIAAIHLAEAGIDQAMREVLSDFSLVAVDRAGELRFYTSPSQVKTVPPRRDIPLGLGSFSYRITDEESRLNVNRLTPPILDRLLRGLGVEKRERDIIIDSLLDWRDANEAHRLNGAESDDHYLKLPVPYRARNANLESVYELLQIRGVTPALFYGLGDTPGLLDYVTAAGTGQVNINTGPGQVLSALGLSEAEVTDIVQARSGPQGPYPNIPGRFAGRFLTTRATHFRVEAVGSIGGQPRARITAVVGRTRGPDRALRPVFHSWRVEPETVPSRQGRS